MVHGGGARSGSGGAAGNRCANRSVRGAESERSSGEIHRGSARTTETHVPHGRGIRSLVGGDSASSTGGNRDQERSSRFDTQTRGGTVTRVTQEGPTGNIRHGGGIRGGSAGVASIRQEGSSAPHGRRIDGGERRASNHGHRPGDGGGRIEDAMFISRYGARSAPQRDGSSFTEPLLDRSPGRYRDPDPRQGDPSGGTDDGGCCRLVTCCCACLGALVATGRGAFGAASAALPEATAPPASTEDNADSEVRVVAASSSIPVVEARVVEEPVHAAMNGRS